MNGVQMPLQTFAVLDSLKRAVISGHQQCGSLEVFHLQWPVGNGPAYVTLDEALASHWIEIAESTESGQVSKIKIINHSEHMIFLMAGEQLVGCKKNRVLNSSIMVPPKAEMPLPVKGSPQDPCQDRQANSVAAVKPISKARNCDDHLR